MSLLQNSNAISAGGYDINNSLRFRSSASASLSRTFGTPTSGQKWTMSFWIKRGVLGAGQLFAKGNTSTAPWTLFYFDANGALNLYEYSLTGTAANFNIATNAVFRDPSAWYHIVVAVDTTQATAANRQIVYVNNVQQTFSSASYYPQNTVTTWNSSGGTSYIFQQGAGATTYTDGYLAETYFVDGQALTPSSFGETDAVTGQWVAKKYTGTYGTNGFYLPFTTSTTTAYAGSFNGSTQYLTTPTSSNFNISTSNFTVEAWVYSTSNSRNVVLNLGPQNTGASSAITMQIEQTSQSYIAYMGDGSTYYTITGGQVGQLNNWVHVALVRSSGVVKLYINGVAGSAVTVSGSPSNSKSWCVGGFLGPAFSYGWTGYISNFRFVNGTAVYTSNFIPPTSALTAITNTQLLTCQNSTAIDNSTNAFTITNNGTTTFGAGNVIFNANIAVDTSGNVNNWTPNNINYSIYGTTYDSMTDSPTLTSATVGNYCTINPLLDLQSYATYSEGNLKISTTASAGYAMRMHSKGTMAIPSSGKWYFAINASDCGVIIGSDDPNRTQYGASVLSTNVRYQSSGDVLLNNNSFATVASFTSSDEVAFAIDMDALTTRIYKNGSLLTTVTGMTSDFTYYPMTIVSSSSTAYTAYWNFGQRPFAYTPPTGYKTLNTYNLPDSTIKKGNKYMDAVTYSGSNSSQTVTNAGSFKPDLVWAKSRSGAYNNILVDAIRGGNLYLVSNSTAADATSSGLATFTSSGITWIGGASGVNTSGDTYVDWMWKGGNGTSSNTSGNITSTVSVNASAGFSIVTYTGNLNASPSGGNDTVGHGLGVAPKMIIFKRRDGASSWMVWHTSLSSVSHVLQLNQTDAQINSATAAGWLGGTPSTPTSTIFGTNYITGRNVSGQTHVAYCWAEIAGFSKFGSYTGNGSTDGPFVYLGFRPKFIMIKRYDAGGENWTILDTSVNTYNLTYLQLFPNSSTAETNGSSRSPSVQFDYLSNGFKLRGANGEVNGSGWGYIYAAFAENPFKNANAR